MKTALAVLAVAVAANASAQVVRAPELSYPASLAASAKTAARDAAARARAVETTIVALNDGIEPGQRVSAWLQDKGVAVYTAAQPEAVRTVVAGGKTSIVLSDKLPARPRVYGPLIAQEAAKALYADMPASGERSYMVMATAAQVFYALGGDFNELPKVDGDDASAVKDAVADWVDPVEATVDELAKRDGVPTIPELQQKAADAKAAEALAAADKRFVAFLHDERELRLSLKR